MNPIYKIIAKFPKDRVEIIAPVQETPALLPETLDLKSPPKQLSNKSSFKEETPKNGAITPKEIKTPTEKEKSASKSSSKAASKDKLDDEEISPDELVKKQPMKI